MRLSTIATQLTKSPANRDLHSKLKNSIGRAPVAESAVFFQNMTEALNPVTENASVELLTQFDEKVTNNDFTGAFDVAQKLAEGAGYSMDFPNFNGGDEQPVDESYFVKLEEHTAALLPKLDTTRQVIQDAITRYDEAVAEKQFHLAVECARKLFQFAESPTDPLDTLLSEVTTSSGVGAGTSAQALGGEDDDFEDDDEVDEDDDFDDDDEELDEDEDEDEDDEDDDYEDDDDDYADDDDDEDTEDDDEDEDEYEDDDDEDDDDDDIEDRGPTEELDPDLAFSDYCEATEQARKGLVRLPEKFIGTQTGVEFTLGCGGVVTEADNAAFITAVAENGGEVAEASMLRKNNNKTNKFARHRAANQLHNFRQYAADHAGHMSQKEVNRRARVTAREISHRNSLRGESASPEVLAEAGLSHYKVHLQADKGRKVIRHVVTKNRDSAIQLATDGEGAPRSAVIKVTRHKLGSVKFGESADTLDEAFSRKHFRAIADTIKSLPVPPEHKKTVAKHYTEIFKASNPRFDSQKFNSACGLVHVTERPADYLGHLIKISESFSRKHFYDIAKRLKNDSSIPAEHKKTIATHLSNAFKQQNPRFAPERFVRACGVNEGVDESWHPEFHDERTAGLIGDQRYKYVPFHKLSAEDQRTARAAYPYKNTGGKYSFKDEHYHYPITKNGKLASGRGARRVLAIPHTKITDDKFMKSMGYNESIDVANVAVVDDPQVVIESEAGSHWLQAAKESAIAQSKANGGATFYAIRLVNTPIQTAFVAVSKATGDELVAAGKANIQFRAGKPEHPVEGEETAVTPAPAQPAAAAESVKLSFPLSELDEFNKAALKAGVPADAELLEDGKNGIIVVTPEVAEELAVLYPNAKPVTE